MVVVLAVVGILTWWVLLPSDADRAEHRWRSCVTAATEMGFDPPEGAEAWCITTTREDR